MHQHASMQDEGFLISFFYSSDIQRTIAKKKPCWDRFILKAVKTVQLYGYFLPSVICVQFMSLTDYGRESGKINDSRITRLRGNL